VPLPGRLQRYDSLIDLLVEQLVREVAIAKTETPAGSSPPAGANSTQDEHAQLYRPPERAAT
jgi:hypothetical protein